MEFRPAAVVCARARRRKPALISGSKAEAGKSAGSDPAGRPHHDCDHVSRYQYFKYNRFTDMLKPADFHILLSLADGPLHGYGIMKEVERESAGSVRLEIGSLYRQLARMLDEGLIEDASGDERRRYYRITRLGRRMLKTEAERLAGLVD